MDIEDYKILTAITRNDLRRYVLDAVKDGWELQGGTSYSGTEEGRWIQAVVYPVQTDD